MATKINVRSPFYIKASNSSLASATMQLYIYTGVLTTDKPASAQYTITKNEIDTNNYVVFPSHDLQQHHTLLYQIQPILFGCRIRHQTLCQDNLLQVR